MLAIHESQLQHRDFKKFTGRTIPKKPIEIKSEIAGRDAAPHRPDEQSNSQ